MFIWKSLQPSLIAKVMAGILPPKDKPESPAPAASTSASAPASAVKAK